MRQEGGELKGFGTQSVFVWKWVVSGDDMKDTRWGLELHSDAFLGEGKDSP